MALVTAFNERVWLLMAAATVLLAIAGCGGSDGGSSGLGFLDGNNDNAAPTDMNGAAQKGPFQPGATARIVAININSPPPTTEAVTDTVDARGRYSFTFENAPPFSVGGDYFEVRVTGRYFDETTGTFANDTRTLRGLFKFNLGNVNLYTHILAPRIEVLIGQGEGFESARNQARNELQQVFDIEAPPGELNLLQDAEHPDDSANLLLFSAALLAANVEQRGLNLMAFDFADDGQINGAGAPVFDAIAAAAANNPNLVDQARLRLMNQYGVMPPDDTDGQLPAWVVEGDGTGPDGGGGVGGGGNPGSGDNPNPGGGGGDPAALAPNTITAVVDGERVTLDNFVVISYTAGENFAATTYFFHPPPSRIEFLFTGGLGLSDPDPNLCDLEPGQRSPLPRVVVNLARANDAKLDGRETFSNVHPNSTCSLIITRNDGIGGTLAGSFAGTLISEGGGSVHITDGAFKVTLPAESPFRALLSRESP